MENIVIGKFEVRFVSYPNRDRWHVPVIPDSAELIVAFKLCEGKVTIAQNIVKYKRRFYELERVSTGLNSQAIVLTIKENGSKNTCRLYTNTPCVDGVTAEDLHNEAVRQALEVAGHPIGWQRFELEELSPSQVMALGLN